MPKRKYFREGTDWFSETGRHNDRGDWVPDVRIFRTAPKRWHIKFRTGSKMAGPFESAREAKDYADQD